MFTIKSSLKQNETMLDFQTTNCAMIWNTNTRFCQFAATLFAFHYVNTYMLHVIFKYNFSANMWWVLITSASVGMLNDYRRGLSNEYPQLFHKCLRGNQKKKKKKKKKKKTSFDIPFI